MQRNISRKCKTRKLKRRKTARKVIAIASLALLFAGCKTLIGTDTDNETEVADSSTISSSESSEHNDGAEKDPIEEVSSDISESSESSDVSDSELDSSSESSSDADTSDSEETSISDDSESSEDADDSESSIDDSSEIVDESSSPSDGDDAADEDSESDGEVVDSGMFSGYAQPNAVTGEYVSQHIGQYHNHNKAADVYSYDIIDVIASIYSGVPLDGENRICFITFDDGVNTKSTPLLLDELNEIGVPATFFLLGNTVSESTRPVLERLMHEGHAIGLHSYNHVYEQLYPNRVANVDEIISQFYQAQDAVKWAIGEEFSTRVYRHPGGAMSWDNIAAADEALNQHYVYTLDWNALNNDSIGNPPTTTEGQIDAILTGWGEWGKPNTMVLLMHDLPAKELTRQSLPAIVEMLRNEGFSFGILE